MPDLVTDGDNLGDHLATRSFKTIKGSDIASATNITIGTSGNTFDITGTTTIEHFDNANWAVGSVVSLHFDGAVVLTNNAGGLTGTQANILLSGDANFTTATGDILTFLLHDSTNWQEVSRNSVASIPDGSITNAKLDTGIDAVKLADGSVTNSELKYINTLSDNAQSQLDLKAVLGANTFTADQSIPATNKLYLDGGGDTYISESSANTIQTYANGVRGMQLYGFGTEVNVSIGAANVLPTASTFGFLQIPTTLGVPTGVPNAVTGKTSICFDQTNLKFMSYVSGVGWKSFSPSGSTIDMGGTDIDNIQNLVHDTSATATTLDFAQDQLQTISISVNTTFATTGVAIGKSKTIKILNNATLHTLTFPAWKFVGAKPTDIAGSKTAILTLTCFGSADADIVAGYAVEE